MSTKTTFKRIALVTVAALGFGVLTSVAPASAVAAGSATVSLGTATTSPVVTGREAVITIPVTVTAAADSDTWTVGVSVVSKPGTSSAADTATYFTSEGTIAAVAAGGVSTYVAAVASTNATNNNYQTQSVTTAGNVATNNNTNSAKFYFTPDKAGTYTIAYFVDADLSGTVTSGDTTKYISITAADAPATAVTITKAIDATYATYDATYGTTNGVWAKLQVTDAAGAASRLNPAQTVKLTLPATLTLASVGSTAVGVTNAEYQLAHASFDSSGVAYINLTAATDGTYALTASVSDSAAVAASSSFKFLSADAYAALLTTGFKNAAATAVAATPIVGSSSANISSASAGTALTTATSHSMYLGTLTAEGVVGVSIASTTLWTSGTTRTTDIVAEASDTLATTDAVDGLTTTRYKATFSVAAPLTINANYAYKTVSVNSFTAAGTAGTAVVLTGAAAAASKLALISPTASTVLAAPAAKTTVQVRCTNQFAAGIPNIVLTPTITGRNSTLAIAAVITNATGYADFSWTDASTSTTALQDSLTFAGCTTSTAMITVNYSSTANLGVSTLTWTAGGGFADADYYVGYTKTAIKAGNDPSTNASTSLTFTVKDANGVAIAGVPVTFALTGNASSLIRKSATVDYTTVYTGSTGTAATQVFAWAPGTSTVTATAGGKTATSYITWKNSTTVNDARVLSATTVGNMVALKVLDRFGNGVEGVSISLTRTGTGFFGTGSSTATAITDGAGTVDVQFVGSGTVKALIANTSAQAYDVANKIAATALTAALAGTTTGTGATLAPAGVYTVSVTVEANSDSATTAGQAAADAAAEATDAANAATDAANAAAEAADAATAAAQDAADAVAALSAQVASLISGLKAQLTALTNLVIKIQKKVKA